MARKRSSRGPPRLPVKQLSILAACRFAEPIAATSVFPYLPEMIESFGVQKEDVAKWAGITSAIFALSQCCTAVFWGRASDRFGRKPVILTGLTITMVMSIVWGLSTSLPMAILSRSLSGGGNGNVGIIRTMVAEMVPEKELQPRAFSVMPLVWSVGSILGPAFGGFFANPSTNLPWLFGNSKFFHKFPFALPNLLASTFFATGILIGILFLKETLETRKNKPDYGIFLGKKLLRLFNKQKPKRYSDYDDGAETGLLEPSSARSSKAFDGEWDRSTKSTQPPPRIWEVFTRQTTINLMAYTFLALHSIAFDQHLPIFMHHPKQIPDEFNTHLPFKFSGGFGLGSGRIGTLFTAYGVVGGLVQFLVFPPIARRYGVLKCFKTVTIIIPLVYLATPYTALIQNDTRQQAAMFAIMVVKCFCCIFAFPCSTILLTNSALSLRVLGTLNGVATSVSGLGRAAGPAISGATFTWGLETGYVITSWWILAAIAMIGAVPVWWLVEMDGFNHVSDDSDDDEEDEDDELSVLEEEPGAIVTGDELLDPSSYEEDAIDTIEGPSLLKIPTTSSSYRAGMHRRMSSPIGIRGGSVGPGGNRRLSNGLGHSNYGQGTGGTTFN